LALLLSASAHGQAQRAGGGAGRTSGTSGSGRANALGYSSGGQIGEAVISSDPETRQIVVIADEQTGKYIGQVITNLDRPKPQVLIKVVFLEVTYSKNSDVGIEGSITKNLNKSNSGSAASDFKSAALGATPLVGGGIFSILNNDFQATLRAIEEAGKTEVLSRPSVLARNNQQAVIIVGQRVPIVTGSQTIALTGGINNTITYENVGIILRVTPFISSDGMVEMIVAPEISSLASQGVSISTGTNAVNAPVINTRSAETVVVTPNGQTVIIGGLMENKKVDSTRKVPLLGDIPLLGAAFRRKVKESAKTELLIFLTPHIIERPSQVAALTEAERGRSDLGTKAFGEQELDRFLDRQPGKGAPTPSGVTPPAPK
jgi:general secretion pathway protein D